MIKPLTSILLLILALNLQATNVRFETTVGNIDIELYDDEAPGTVANFLNYVNRGDYDGTVIHRTDPGFVVQGGGFRFLGNSTFEAVLTDAPITNEAQISNTVGTIAMARNTNPNSATNQWFFNLANNSFLDAINNNAGYAVFGKITRGAETIDIIESLLRINFFDATPAGVFGEFPLYKYDEGNDPQQSNPILDRNVVKINRAYVLSEEFQITPGLSGAWFNPATDGQGIYLEVLPSLDTIIMAWFAYDTEQPDAAVPSTIGAAGNRWLTAVGSFQGNQFIGKVYKTSGGLFDDPIGVSNTEIGEVIIIFNSCGQAVMSYVLNDSGLSNSINIQRLSGSNIEFCEQLAIEANQGVSTQ